MNKYQETVNWLYKQFPSYQKKGKRAYNKNFTNLKIFLDENKIDYSSFPIIHIAGTNGKGSVSHMLSSVFQESGRKTGLFTSPHIIDFRERIKINGHLISKMFVIDFVQKYKSVFEIMNMSFFEMNVALAFAYFSAKKIDVAVIETGLGGRLDATNLVNPLLSIITNISLDHTNLLGKSLESITKEKAGIIKKNTPVVVGQKNYCSYIIEEFANQMNSELFYAESSNFKTDLNGMCQKYNVNTCVTALDVLNRYNFNSKLKHILSGLKNVIKNTDLKGRWQILRHKPKLIIDIAHNVNAIKLVVDQLLQTSSNKHIIIGFSSDKDIDSIVSILPCDFNYYICGSFNKRVLSPNKYSNLFMKRHLNYQIFDFSYSAYIDLINNCDIDDVIFVTGSTFIVSDMLNYLDKV